jgi:hypothetical protein
LEGKEIKEKSYGELNYTSRETGKINEKTKGHNITKVTRLACRLLIISLKF